MTTGTRKKTGYQVRPIPAEALAELRIRADAATADPAC
jgi:hypothetical protein